MIKNLGLIEAKGYDPYANLALERLLFEQTGPNCCVLYLWQNAHTVVIGRNQNALDECDVCALEAEGGHLVRRLSGGGAVYHDLGNLNFTFLIPTKDFDIAKQNAVILNALQSLGINAQATGRNDLTVDGRKFSGCAYLHEGEHSYHHGTLLVAADFGALSRYLQPSPLKLQARGVKSIRSRVVNLSELSPSLTIQQLKSALGQSFGKVFNSQVERIDSTQLDEEYLEQLRTHFASPAWNLGKKRHLSQGAEARFSWGTVRLDLEIAEGLIQQAYLWTDALAEGLPILVERALSGCALDAFELRSRLEGEKIDKQVAFDLAQLVLSIAAR